jgi:ATP-dependent HslUV protease subunit HslV
MLQKYSGNLLRSAVELAQSWRTDRMLGKLEAMMIVADKDKFFLISGDGNVIEPDGGVVAIGSGGNYALAAARALITNTKMTAKEVAKEAMRVAGEICIFTNSNLTIEEI